MTLSTLTSRVTYPGAGSAGPFAIPFRFLTNADLRVIRRSALGTETLLTLASHYTVTGAGEVAGTLTLVTALAVGETLVIRRDPALEQPTSIRNQGAYFPATIEESFDRLVMQMQAQQDEIDRCLKLSETLTGGASLTELEPEAGKVVTGTGTGFTMSTLDSSAVALPGGGRTVSTLSAYLANNAVLNWKDFGAVGDYVADDTAAIQACFDAGMATKLLCTAHPGRYKTTSTLVIDDHYFSFIGMGEVSVGWGSSSTPFAATTYGATIRYTGTGTALLIGISPGVNSDFIYGTKLKNLRVEVADNAAIAMRVWHSLHGRFDRIAIFGMKGPTNIGLQVEAGVDNIYEQVDVNGGGQTNGAGSTEYAKGLVAKLGFNNDLATTTIFRRCYLHYCHYAADLAGYLFEFEDTVFEASTYGVVCGTDCVASFMRCWWEANVTGDIYTSNAKIVIGGHSRINSYARQAFFEGGGGTQDLVIRDTTFGSSHASPLLFATGPSAMAATGRGLISGCRFPANFQIGGANNNDYRRIQMEDMRKETYRFKAAAVTGTVTISPMLSESGLTVSWVAPEKGHFIGLNIFSSGALTGGTYDYAAMKNGAAVALLTFGTTAVQRVMNAIPHFKEKFAAGDLITVYFHTTTLTSTTDFIAEIIVAFGDDGIGL